MRKKQKQMIREFIPTLFEAHDEAKKHIRKGKLPVAMGLLGQCQEGIIKVGTLIEESQGEGFVTVGLIEEYCELTFHAYEELRQQEEAGKKSASDKIYKALDKKLVQIQNSINNDIEIRTEAVFLPYKASMWDSLESVWQAADEDPACDAYVIPIPYYDRKPDGSFGEMHYEGDLYPDYVPVTHYDAYDFEGRQPDMIYIHNPYDDTNIVTSVHPFFYSKNLKNFTENLVYIPYFILAEPTAFDAKSLEGVAHFFTTPAVVNADKVIVQSEAMKRAYVETLTRAAGEESRGVWEEKILGLGSPKLDKVARTDRDTLDIPEDWQSVITKLDGSRKKIIFYNTSVGALLEHDEKMLAKMRHVFDIFKENIDDVALLWRPHPLIKATIESMRPQLWAGYEKLVEQYRKEGWGIYDDTPELDRAIALCDGYYGDYSSVVQLCQKAGKPVMVQDVDLTDDDNSGSGVLTFGAFYDLEDEKLWLPSREINGLFMVDFKRDNKARFISTFENSEGAWKIVKVIPWKNKIFFFSRDAYKVWILDKESYSMRAITYSSLVGFAVANVELHDGVVWILPTSFSLPIICLDLETLKTEIIPWNIDETLSECSITRSVLQEDEIFLATRKENQIHLCTINCESKRISHVHLESLSFINCLTVNEDSVWILGRTKTGKTVLQEYDLNVSKLQLTSEVNIKGLEQLEETVSLKYFKTIIYEKKIIFVPAFAHKIMVYEQGHGRNIQIDYPETFRYLQTKLNPVIFFEAEKKGNLIYLYPYASRMMMILNLENYEIDVVDVICEEKEYEKAWEKQSDETRVLIESNNELVNFFKSCSYIRKNKQLMLRGHDVS